MAEKFRNRPWRDRRSDSDWWDNYDYRQDRHDSRWDNYAGPGYRQSAGSRFDREREDYRPFGSESRSFDNYGYGNNNMSDYGYGSNAGYRGGYGHYESGGWDRDRGAGYNRRWEDDPENRARGRRYEREDDRRDWWDRASDEVASWFGDDSAQRRRNQDKRYGEHRGKGPKGYRRSDERIREDINDRLSYDGWVDASDIDVRVENGEVTLSGHVNHRQDKRRAEDIAESVSGVQNVENRLRLVRSDQEDYVYPTATTTGGATNTNSKVENGRSRKVV